MSNLLEISKLSVSYGIIDALKEVSINVPEGKIVAILGSNGGGKTTLLKKISGLVDSKSGTIIFNNEDITEMSPEKITNKGIVQSPEGRQIFPDLTVEENLKIGAFTVKPETLLYSKIYPNSVSKRIKKLYSKFKDEDFLVKLKKEEVLKNNLERVYRYFPVLKERKSQIAKTLSGGEQQMLAISRALMASPKLLILDEPSLGLAPLIVKDIFKIIKEFKKEGTTILIVEQNALQTLKIADYVYVLQLGEVNMEGEAKELIKDPKLIEAYLGNR